MRDKPKGPKQLPPTPALIEVAKLINERLNGRCTVTFFIRETPSEDGPKQETGIVFSMGVRTGIAYIPEVPGRHDVDRIVKAAERWAIGRLTQDRYTTDPTEVA